MVIYYIQSITSHARLCISLFNLPSEEIKISPKNKKEITEERDQPPEKFKNEIKNELKEIISEKQKDKIISKNKGNPLGKSSGDNWKSNVTSDCADLEDVGIYPIDFAFETTLSRMVADERKLSFAIIFVE